MSVEPCGSERVFTRTYPFWYLFLNNSLLPKVTWKMGEGIHWKETTAYRLCSRFRWACGRNLPAQCLALQGTSEASFQKPDKHSWSVFSELRPLAGMQRDELAALPSPQWTLEAFTPQLSALSPLTALCLCCSSLSSLEKHFVAGWTVLLIHFLNYVYSCSRGVKSKNFLAHAPVWG